MNAFLTVQVLNHWRIFACQLFETLFSSRIRKTSAIENKAAAIAGVIFGQSLMEGEAEDAHCQSAGLATGWCFLGFGPKVLKLLGSQHVAEGFQQRRKRNRNFSVVQEPADVFQSKWNALQEMRLPLVETTESICAKCLHHTDIDVSVIVTHEGFTWHRHVVREHLQVMIQEPLSYFRREIRFSVVEQRGNIVLQGSLAAALVIYKEWLAIAQHDVSRLEVAIHKVFVLCRQEKLCEPAEVVL